MSRQPADQQEILRLTDLAVHFPVRRGIWQRKMGIVKAVDGVNLTVKRGETLGLVGESGCGKTTIGRTVIRLYKPTSGSVWFEGKDISTLNERELRPVRRRMSLIFQDPSGSLDPRKSAGNIVGAPLRIHHLVKGRKEYSERVEQLFRLVGLDPSMIDRVPHEFSGGQRQRIGIARALACRPRFIVCDEPVSALDVSIQAQVINLLEDLQAEFEISYLFIAHDLAVVRHISDRVAVMYMGKIVEMASREELFSHPLHPYTLALLSAVPVPDPKTQRKRIVLEGGVPSAVNPPDYCRFYERGCPRRMPRCKEACPPLVASGPDHYCACFAVNPKS